MKLLLLVGKGPLAFTCFKTLTSMHHNWHLFSPNFQINDTNLCPGIGQECYQFLLISSGIDAKLDLLGAGIMSDCNPDWKGLLRWIKCTLPPFTFVPGHEGYVTISICLWLQDWIIIRIHLIISPIKILRLYQISPWPTWDSLLYDHENHFQKNPPLLCQPLD